MTSLHIVLDLPAVLNSPATSESGVITNPVAYYAEHVMPGVSIEVIAYSWAAVAIALLGGAFYFSIIRQLRRIPKNDDLI